MLSSLFFVSTVHACCVCSSRLTLCTLRRTLGIAIDHGHDGTQWGPSEAQLDLFANPIYLWTANGVRKRTLSFCCLDIDHSHIDWAPNPMIMLYRTCCLTQFIHCVSNCIGGTRVICGHGSSQRHGPVIHFPLARQRIRSKKANIPGNKFFFFFCLHWFPSPSCAPPSSGVPPACLSPPVPPPTAATPVRQEKNPPGGSGGGRRLPIPRVGPAGPTTPCAAIAAAPLAPPSPPPTTPPQSQSPSRRR